MRVEDPRVLYVVGNSLPHTVSGYSNRAHAVARAAVEEGVDLRVMTRIGYPSIVGVPFFPPHDVLDGVVYTRALPWVYPLTPRGWIEKSARAISRIVVQQNINVLHTTTGFTNAIPVARVARELQIPWVYEVRGELEKTWLSKDERRSETSEYFERWRAQETAAARAATRVITLSEISKQGLVDRGVEGEKIHVVPNSVESRLLDDEFSPAEVRSRLGLGPGYWIGSVTSVVDYEGLDLAVRALPKLADDVRLLIVGDGESRVSLENLANDLGVRDRVVFAGQKVPSEAIEWYKALDVFVVPRKDVPVCRTVTPIKPLAAMGMGIPVVAADLPALREVTGGCTYYFVPGSVHSLVDQVERVRAGKYDNAVGRAWARTRTWERVGEELASIYSGQNTKS
ncbi:glycosyltransferase family 4 protein [Corynebacterium qintianiae]|uniref:glycosyltransferase family 4 protein n=1 Tax=Corynebacterium qintianiae TaxID=2709392 RepID=UPI0013EB39D5|nr:glycosyltransferase family 4 protein [Corynebacterium qintianiae]